MSIKAWLTEYRTPLLVGAALVALEMLTAALFTFGAPPGQRWLGNTLLFPNDTAVYLSYIEQGAQGSILLQNLYAVEPNTRRLDPFWSTLGLAARSGLPPLLVLEIARWLLTMVLVFSLFGLVRRDPLNGRYSSFLTWVMALGASGGWIYSLGIHAFGAWRIDTKLAPDIASEFSIFPALLSGPHMILSIALLVMALRWAWQGFGKNSLRSAIFSAAASALLFSFHPYFIPIFLVFWAIACAYRRSLGMRKLALRIMIYGTSLVPALALYLPLYFDPTFRNHHLAVNYLPLAPALSWIFALAPFAIALAWRWRRKLGLRQDEYWIVAWIVAALACACSPLPWTRKFLEGTSVALILLTAPFWIWLRERLTVGSNPWMKPLMTALLVLGLGLGSFQLLTSHFAWSHDPSRAVWLYRPTALFDAWELIKQSSDKDSILVTDDLWNNSFSPAYTGRQDIVGHDHEAPRFPEKYKDWRSNLIEGDAEAALRYLSANSITHLILTKPETQEKLSARLEEAGWRKAFDQGSVAVWTASGI